MNKSVKVACERYKLYLESILQPATKRFEKLLDSGTVSLDEAFSATLFAAHAIDYILAIRSAKDLKGGRVALVNGFDESFSIEGGRFQNSKFRLVDAINNALKHMELDSKRYPDLIEKYGAISFQCLVEEKGRVVCLLDGYRFDYCRVVLRPILKALTGWSIDDLEDVLEFSLGEFGSFESYIMASFTDDPIDQMIEYCNPICSDCGEGEEDCYCATYIYDGQAGEFAPIKDEFFDFDSCMSRISGAY